MDFGVHLPIIAFQGQTFSHSRLVDVARAAEDLGFAAVCTNDHLVFSRPWFDSLTALAAVVSSTSRISLMTTIALPVIRGPMQLAKALAALDILSGGRMVAGVGPGSSREDYALAGIPFEERWPRFDEAVHLLRSLLSPGAPSVSGRFYPPATVPLEPTSPREGGMPIWVGSWGSDVGLRRVARLGDGWLASAYNVTPASFADALSRLRDHLQAAGKEPERFPHALATMFFYLTDNRQAAEETLTEVASALNRSADQLREQLLIGSPAACIEKLSALKTAGVELVLLWPVADDVAQLTRFREVIAPHLSA